MRVCTNCADGFIDFTAPETRSRLECNFVFTYPTSKADKGLWALAVIDSAGPDTRSPIYNLVPLDLEGPAEPGLPEAGEARRLVEQVLRSLRGAGLSTTVVVDGDSSLERQARSSEFIDLRDEPLHNADPASQIVVVHTSANSAAIEAALVASGLQCLSGDDWLSALGGRGPRATCWAPAEKETTSTTKGGEGSGAKDLLTPREVDVLEAFANGALMIEVARDLFVSPKTVKNHLAHIYSKLGVVNRTQAISKAVKCGLVRIG